SRGGSVVIHRGTLHILRSRFLWQGSCYEELKFVNYGMDTLPVPLNLCFAADFHDIFQVRGMSRERAGRMLEPEVSRDTLVLGCEGLDRITRRTRIRCEPVPTDISGEEMNFRFELKPKGELTISFEMTFEGETKPSKEYGYPQASRRAETEMKTLTRSLPQVASSNSRFNDWVRRSSADVQMMTIGNP